MAVVFPAGIEVFGNCSSCVATSTYGTTNPAAGTTESWTMGTGYTSFPAATFNASTTFTNPSATPPGNYFYIRDPADTTNEIVLVYAGGGSTSTWYVQRGMNGTTVAHASGATWVQVISPYTLQSFKQASNATVSGVTLSNTSTETVVATYTPFSGEIEAGSVFDLIATGVLKIVTTGTLPTLQWTLYSGGSGAAGSSFTSTGSTVLCQILTGSTATTNCSPPLATTTSSTTAVGGTGSAARMGTGVSFDVNGTVEWISTTSAIGNLNFYWTIPGAGTASFTIGISAVASSATTLTGLTASNPMILTCKWGTASTSNVLTSQAPVIFRAA